MPVVNPVTHRSADREADDADLIDRRHGRRAGIGKDGRVPWHLRADLQRFKALTMGHHLIVGRKTWESIGRPLPGRKMVIITRNPAYQSGELPGLRGGDLTWRPPWRWQQAR